VFLLKLPERRFDLAHGERCGVASFQRFVDFFVGADFVVATISEAFQGKIARVNVSYQAFTHNDLVKEALSNWHHATVETDPSPVPYKRQIQVMGLQ
jgi:hypothetical protein